MKFRNPQNFGPLFVTLYLLFTALCFVLSFALGGISEGLYYFLFRILPTMPWSVITESLIPPPYVHYVYFELGYIILNVLMAYGFGVVVSKIRLWRMNKVIFRMGKHEKFFTAGFIFGIAVILPLSFVFDGTSIDSAVCYWSWPIFLIPNSDTLCWCRDALGFLPLWKSMTWLILAFGLSYGVLFLIVRYVVGMMKTCLKRKNP